MVFPHIDRGYAAIQHGPERLHGVRYVDLLATFFGYLPEHLLRSSLRLFATKSFPGSAESLINQKKTFYHNGSGTPTPQTSCRQRLTRRQGVTITLPTAPPSAASCAAAMPSSEYR